MVEPFKPSSANLGSRPARHGTLKYQGLENAEIYVQDSGPEEFMLGSFRIGE